MFGFDGDWHVGLWLVHFLKMLTCAALHDGFFFFIVEENLICKFNFKEKMKFKEQKETGDYQLLIRYFYWQISELFFIKSPHEYE